MNSRRHPPQLAEAGCCIRRPPDKGRHFVFSCATKRTYTIAHDKSSYYIKANRLIYNDIIKMKLELRQLLLIYRNYFRVVFIPMNYGTDLTDEQWRLIRSHIPRAKQGGRPREANMRRVVDAIMYVVTHGCKWRGLPKDFPPWRTVYGYFADLQERGRWRHIHYDLYGMVRKVAGRDEQPSLLVIDSQSVKTGKVLWCRLFLKNFTKNFLMVSEIGRLFQYFSGTIMLSGTGWRM